MPQLITDLLVARDFTEVIYNDYCVALEFLDHSPDYSLLKFRLITESLLEEIARFHKLEFETDNTFERIECLFDVQIINKLLKDDFHIIRKLCNSGVHKAYNDDLFQENNVDNENNRKKLLIDKATKVRKKINSIFLDVSILLKREQKIKFDEIHFVSIKTLDLKELLFEALIEVDFKKKIKAGVLCESINKEQTLQQGMIIDSNTASHNEFLEKMALNFYDAACQISAQFDKNSHDYNDKEKIITKYSDAEALFRFSNSLLTDSNLEDDLSKVAWGRLRASAERDYLPAKSLYGAYLYQLKEYEDALKYLKEASDKDDLLALRILFLYYSDKELTVFDKDIAKNYLAKGIDLGCPDCLATLGIGYHKGEIFEKNDIKANEYLEDSIKKGSALGLNYYRWNFKNSPEKFASDLRSALGNLFGANLGNQSKSIGHKIGRNEKCICGSGIKYKKCCGA